MAQRSKTSARLVHIIRIAACGGVLGAIVAIAAFQPVAAGPLCASLGSPGETEKLRLLHFDAASGEESFRASPDSTGRSLVVTAESKGSLPGQTFAFTQRLVVDADDYALRSYELTADVAGIPQTIRAERAGDSLIVAVEAQGRRLRRAFAERGGTLVLDNLLGNHLALLACRVARDGFRAETLRVVVPQVGGVFPAVVTPHPPAADGTRPIDVGIASVTETLRLDAGGRLAAVDVPLQNLRFERVGEPGAGQAAGATPRRPPAEKIPDEAPTPTRMLFEERTVRFPSRDMTIEGVLTVPQGGQKIPYPTVLLIQDAGPLDHDETVGPNRPFRDLARGLAVEGVMSLRYDKRSLAAPFTLDPRTETVQQDVIADALVALEYLHSLTEADTKRITIVGHGLGGAIAAEIAKQDRRVAGIVILAGSPRPLDALLRDRFAFIEKQERALGNVSADEEAMYRKVAAQLDSLDAGQLPPDREIVDTPAGYLRDYRGRDLAGELMAFRGPVLILRGEKDYEVTRADIDLWRAAAERGGKRNVTIRELPGLDHYLIPVAGEPGPANYAAPGQLDPEVIDEIATFAASPR